MFFRDLLGSEKGTVGNGALQLVEESLQTVGRFVEDDGKTLVQKCL